MFCDAMVRRSGYNVVPQDPVSTSIFFSPISARGLLFFRPPKDWSAALPQ